MATAGALRYIELPATRLEGKREEGRERVASPMLEKKERSSHIVSNRCF